MFEKVLPIPTQAVLLFQAKRKIQMRRSDSPIRGTAYKADIDMSPLALGDVERGGHRFNLVQIVLAG
jgi:hypothetical protein